MAKPPKKVPGSRPSDTSSTTTRPMLEESPAAGDRVNVGHSDPHSQAGASPPGAHSSDASTGGATHQQSVVVSDMPGPGNSAESANTQAPAVVAPARTESSTFIPAHLAAKLTKAEGSVDGIRYDKLKKTYVEMQEGTVRVHKHPDGSYQQTSVSELIPSGALLEQIAGTKLWRRKAQTTTTTQESPRPDVHRPSAESDEPRPGPSKRPRLDKEDSHSPDTEAFAESLLSDESGTLDLSYGLGRNWGKTTKPQSGESIEIDGLHYPIVPQVMLADTRLVYLEHPGFSPGRYDAFEQMLLNDPSLQPKWAVKKDDQWKIVERRPPFEMSLTQYVTRSFQYLSDHTVSAVARAVFNQAGYSEVINGHGLSVMSQTFRHWADRAHIDAPRRELADPIMMLPKLPTTNNGTEKTISLPSPSLEALQRLDFDPKRFPQVWSEYVMGGPSLRSLFSTVLEHNGYIVNRTTRVLSEDALLFHREELDAVFVLRFPATSLLGNIRRHTVPGSELSDPAYRSRIGEEQWQELNQHLDPDKAIYLLGCTQPVGPDQSTLVIVREG